MSVQDNLNRTVLPIPDQAHVGLTTYDAKDPDTKFPPIEQLRPPAGAPNVLIVLIDDAGFGSSSAFGGPCATPNVEKLGDRRPEVQPLSHDGALLAHPPGAADRAQPPFGRAWAASPRSRPRRPVTTRSCPTPVAACRNAEAQRLLDRAVRQVSRGAGLADQPDGPVRSLAERRRWLRAFLRIHRR